MFVTYFGNILTNLVDNRDRFTHKTTSIEQDGNNIYVKGKIKNKYEDIKIEELKNYNKFTKDDLKRNDLYVVYLYYDKNDFNCVNCRYFRRFLENITTELRFVNFGSDVFLASKFHTYIFPAFIVRYKQKSYKLENIQTGEELIELVNDLQEDTENRIKHYVEMKNMVQFKRYMEPGKFCNTFLCYANILIFRFIDMAYFVLKYVPSWVFNVFVGLVILYLIWSIISTLMDFRDLNKTDKNK